MENIQNITLDIMNNKYSDYIYAKQHDRNRTIRFYITENGKPVNIDNIFCTFIMKIDAYVAIESVENVDGQYFQLNLNTKLTRHYGKIPYQLILTKSELVINPDGSIDWGGDDTIIGTVNGVFLVDQCVIDEGDVDIDDPHQQSILEELLAIISQSGTLIEEARQSANASAASAEESDGYAQQSAEYRDSSAEYSVISKSYAVGGTSYKHEGIDDDEDNAKYYYNLTQGIYDKVIFAKKITLLSDGWDENTNQQTVVVPGVIADQDYQLIVVRPRQEFQTIYANSNVLCIEQQTDQLLFQCDIKPLVDIPVYVAITDVNLVDKKRRSQFLINETEPTLDMLNENDYWIVNYE